MTSSHYHRWHKKTLLSVTVWRTPSGFWIWTIPHNESKSGNPSWQTQLHLVHFMVFMCVFLHLPSICLLRPLSVPRTLPHPLQIRFQRRHTPRERSRENNGGLEQTHKRGARWLWARIASPEPSPSTSASSAAQYGTGLQKASLCLKKKDFLACPCWNSQRHHQQ